MLIPAGLLLLLLAQIAGMQHWFGPGEPAGVTVGGSFRLEAPNGPAVSPADFHGRWMLVSFGTAPCDDRCAVTLGNIAQALRLLGTASNRVAPLFIHAGTSHAEAARFDPRILDLAGTPAEIASVRQMFRVGDKSDRPVPITVMDPDNRFVGRLDGDATPDAIAGRLRRLGV